MFLIGGVTTEWDKIGKILSKVPEFIKTIDRCQKILLDKDIDLMLILEKGESESLSTIEKYVATVAIQIGVINVFRKLGVNFDYLVGISSGEIAVAYADNCLSEEQTLLAAYYRGLIVSQGSNRFFSWFYKFPNYLAYIGNQLLNHMNQVITEPKKRSSKWLSTSISPESWSDSKSQYCTGEYLVNTLLGKVYLDEACENLPRNSLVLDISSGSTYKSRIEEKLPEVKFLRPFENVSMNEDLLTKSLLNNGIKVERLTNGN